MATHWDLDGRPDGSTPLPAAVALMAVPAALAALVLAVSVLRSRHQARPATPGATAAIGAAVGGLFATLSAATVVANAGAATWHDATLRPGAVIATVAAGVTAPVALASWALAPAAPPPATDRSLAGRRTSTRVAWAGSCHARWPGLAAAVVAGAAILASLQALWLAAYLALAALAVLAVGTVHVTAGVRGVRAVPPTAWPGVRIPLDRIASARAIDLRPMRWGGWGYRGSLRFLGRAAWVLRAGPALELTLVDGRVFAVTIDGAGEAAAVVNELLSGAGGPGDGQGR